MKEYFWKKAYEAGKSGSLALILPKEYCRELNITKDTMLEIKKENGKITIRKLEVK